MEWWFKDQSIAVVLLHCPDVCSQTDNWQVGGGAKHSTVGLHTDNECFEVVSSHKRLTACLKWVCRENVLDEEAPIKNCLH